ncbi:DUF6161 domain-containing protein [Pyruvatibacter sp.]
MVQQIEDLVWKFDKKEWPDSELRQALPINAVRFFAERETSAAENLERTLARQNMGLPPEWWKGARDIRNGIFLLEDNPSLARSLITAGLEEYDQGRSILLHRYRDHLNELLASGELHRAEDLLDKIAPEVTNVPYPEELDEPYFPSQIAAPDVSKFKEKVEELEKNLSSIVAGIERSDKNWQIKQHAISDEIEQTAKRLNGLQFEASQAVEGVKSSFQEKMILNEPIGYWKARAKQHKVGRWYWLGGFSACLVVFVAVAGLMVSNNWDELRQLEATQVSVILIGIGVPVAMVLWFIRTVARIYQNEAALYDDALERQTMLEAYVAMLASGDVDSDDRGHVLKAVFRPRTTDAMDDGQAMPVSQIVKIFQDETPKGQK